MGQLGLGFHIFHHDRQRLRTALDGLEHPNLHPVDLNDIPLPKRLRLKPLREDENRAVLSEYLGHYSLAPRGTMVGTATYSIPLKFSHEWAKKTGCDLFCSPPLTFRKLLSLEYRPEYCYGVELKAPYHQFQESLETVHDRFRVGPASMPELGPIKGTVVVERNAYLDFQSWFRDVVPFLLETFPWQAQHPATPFSQSEFSEKSDSERSRGRYRGGLGVLLEHVMAYYFGQTFRGRLVRLGDEVARHFPDTRFEQTVRDVARDNTVVIAFANAAYSTVMENWVTAAKRAGADNVLIIALDETTRKACNRLEIPCYRIAEVSPDFPEIMRIRVRVFRLLCMMGVNFINSDIDAMWLRDPQPFLRELPGDLLISEGTIQPPELHEQWGFTLCSGFFMARGSSKMRAFFERMLEDDRGDQISLNHALHEDGIAYDIPDPYTLPFRGKSVRCSKSPIVGRSTSFEIRVLPHHLFQRIVDDDTEALVKHPQAPKDQQEKLQALKSMGLYYL